MTRLARPARRGQLAPIIALWCNVNDGALARRANQLARVKPITIWRTVVGSLLGGLYRPRAAACSRGATRAALRSSASSAVTRHENFHRGMRVTVGALVKRSFNPVISSLFAVLCVSR